MKLIAKSSLYKPFHDTCPEDPLESLTALRGETVSLQFVCMYDDAPDNTCDAYISVDTALPYKLYETVNVPVMRPAYSRIDEWYERTTPGLYPDALASIREDGRVRLPKSYYKSFWVTLNADGEDIAAGDYTVTFTIKAREVTSVSVAVKIIDAVLEPQKLIYTNWFHCDCLCDRYGCSMFDDKHMELIGKYAALAAKNGMNMILVPCFTPPLDTPVGGERMTAQLVDVEVTEDGYKFGFDKLRRFLRLCEDNGIVYFEHSHLFSQWGAEHAPKVVDVNGKLLFGWDTDAIDENGEYAKFLRQYLTELMTVLEETGIGERMYFHISDEPNIKHLENYQRASSLVKPYIGSCHLFEALSSYEFYQTGAIEIPIPTTTHADKFLGNVENLWVYYTGGESHSGYSNRLISMPNARNRILGVQLWYYDIKGFLQWAYNFWYTRLSEMPFDPWSSPDSKEYFVGGTSFMVYPDTDGPTPSMRLYNFAEGINDIRALDTYAKKVGREKVREFIDSRFENFGLRYCPSEQQLLKFREELNAAIAK